MGVSILSTLSCSPEVHGLPHQFFSLLGLVLSVSLVRYGGENMHVKGETMRIVGKALFSKKLKLTYQVTNIIKCL